MMGQSAECPFCTWQARGESPSDIEARMREHIGWFHQDRVVAQRSYQQVLAQTGDMLAARRAYNRALVPNGPGRYDRKAKVATA